MERRLSLLMLATGLWTVTIGLAIYVSLSPSLATAMWAVVAGQGACTATALVAFDISLARERARVEDIAAIAATEAARLKGGVQPLRQ